MLIIYFPSTGQVNEGISPDETGGSIGGSVLPPLPPFPFDEELTLLSAARLLSSASLLLSPAWRCRSSSAAIAARSEAI